jgi:dihydroorotate dehydrogenase (NAD+) catalytic subunit
MDRIAGRKKIGNKQVMPFTISSGIVTTEVSCLERIANEVPEIGIFTTKSIGPVARTVPEGDEVLNPVSGREYGCREPIIAQYAPNCFVNAVRLTNPGANAFKEKLSRANIPTDKFLLVSVFGKDAEEFVYVAETLEQYADGFELNKSCPHAKGHGLAVGQDAELSDKITRAVRSVTKKPIFEKYGANIPDLGERARRSLEAGATGFTLINTAGPGCHISYGYPVLSNEIGGLSGAGILPLGIKAVRDVVKAVGRVPIIGMGGIRLAEGVEAYANSGATFFGIGSALAGMDEKTLKAYFAALAGDLDSGGWTNNAMLYLRQVDMSYHKVRVTKRVDAACDFRLIQTDYALDAKPGQFDFAWIPGVGEKPFSVMDDDPLTLGVLERGHFTHSITKLNEGDSFYVRGPYGTSPSIPAGEDIVLVGGGCGVAGLYLFAKHFAETNRITVFLGAKDKKHLPYLSEFGELCEFVNVATEDGSLGRKGLVTDLLQESDFVLGSYFFNCGPKAMVKGVLPIELEMSFPERVYSSVDYMTRCGVGICGSCADEKGRRTCVEGPFMSAE